MSKALFAFVFFGLHFIPIVPTALLLILLLFTKNATILLSTVMLEYFVVLLWAAPILASSVSLSETTNREELEENPTMNWEIEK